MHRDSEQPPTVTHPTTHFSTSSQHLAMNPFFLQPSGAMLALDVVRDPQLLQCFTNTYAGAN
jgi:hypothetical protein